MANYQKIKGTRDFYGDKSIKLAFIENVTREVAIKYGYGEIVTPIFENTDDLEKCDIKRKEILKLMPRKEAFEYWEYSFIMPDAPAFLEFKTYDGMTG